MSLQNPVNLDKLSQMELEKLRAIIGSHQLMATKLSEYSNQCEDVQIKNMFNKGAQSALTTAKNLTNSL